MLLLVKDIPSYSSIKISKDVRRLSFHISYHNYVSIKNFAKLKDKKTSYIVFNILKFVLTNSDYNDIMLSDTFDKKNDVETYDHYVSIYINNDMRMFFKSFSKENKIQTKHIFKNIFDYLAIHGKKDEIMLGKYYG